MFKVTLEEFLQIFVIVMLIGSAAIWLVAVLVNMLVKRRRRRERMRCRLCLLRFIDDRKTRLGCCPHCGALNERKR